jgi:hypothetical protein
MLLMLALLLFCKSAIGQEAADHALTSSSADVGVRPVPGPPAKRPDFNEDIYYKNRLEFSLETGWLPINIPFVYNFITGDSYTRRPLNFAHP